MLFNVCNIYTDGEIDIVPLGNMNNMQTFIGIWILILFAMSFTIIWKVFAFGFHVTVSQFQRITHISYLAGCIII